MNRAITGLVVVTLCACSSAVVPSSSQGSSAGSSTTGTSGTSSAGSTGSSAASSGSGSSTGSLASSGSSGSGASSPLPFDLPPQSVLKGSPHKVFAHYFTPFPISLDNKDPASDYYATQYLTPGGERGVHAAYGGFLRARPLPRPVNPSPAWELEDMKTEVERATSAGLDGFTVDILSLSAPHFSRIKTLLAAAPQVDPRFKIVLMPDGTSSDVRDAGALASAVASLESTSAAALFHLPDGRLVISPFDPERLGATYWQDWLNVLKTQYGIDVAFVPCFLNYSSSVAAFEPFSFGFSNWGSRSPATNSNLAPNIASAHSRGKLWMQPVSVQDERPNQSLYDEADNSENLRLTWAGAIGGSDGGADWVQIPTWNDYSEGAQLAPSTGTGWSPLDLSTYWLIQFKIGTAPAIVRDVIYLSHRVQRAGATVTGETAPMVPRPGTSTPRDDVEVLSFLTAPATIVVTIGGVASSYAAPAGVHAELFPLGAGEISAVVQRNGIEVAQVRSPYPVTLGDVVIQDESYRFVSSGRGE